ncbi:unnamed protein product [Angiostrongylus costaricensis]|uniref:Uncharacterized protein n=1 Tax=Angiostrongylus costaricensis TaxID=334426 RepID=A0A0R3PPC1_ANGCS|nr:unnamed protein product [Angiostrongylus costaricensis]
MDESEEMKGGPECSGDVLHVSMTSSAIAVAAYQQSAIDPNPNTRKKKPPSDQFTFADVAVEHSFEKYGTFR